jgi:V/A-type H+-transporting ATPase subunit I
VLFLLGFLTSKYGLKIFSSFRKFSTPLISIGIASMVMGFLTGEVFTNEDLLIKPTRIITELISGSPTDRVLYILPIAEKGGSIKKLFYFMGFTISIGIILNIMGMIINVINRCILKKYEEAFLSKTGLMGLLLFLYVIIIAIRIIFGIRLRWFDILIVSMLFFCILFVPVIIRIAKKRRPVLEYGLFTFFIEIFVEVLEIVSSFLSNTISFVRVSAFALSHAVLSFVVFSFTEQMVISKTPSGTFSALLIMIFGNAIIIVLEGLIVAIQVIRLQYYEFFSKFFFDTGMEFKPFTLITRSKK